VVSQGSPTGPGPNARWDSGWRRLPFPAVYRRTGSGPARPGGAVARLPGGVRVAHRGCRWMDVLCAGMYRACSTWQYEVIAHLVEHHGGGRRLGYLTGAQYAALIRGDAGHGSLAPGTAWRVLKSHEGDRCFARALAEGRAVAVYAHRDVRDVVFSLMHKRGLTFEQLLRQGMLHQILANDRFWTRQPGVLIQRYDDLLADPVGGVLGLARHLGIALTDGEAAAIAAAYSLESNKARTEALRRRLEQAGLDLNEAGNTQICDATTLLHWNHVRNGGSGSWLTQSTPAQRAILDRLCARWLSARSYPLRPAGAESGPLVEAPIGWRDALRLQLDRAIGLLNYRVRALSQQFPRLARRAKRLLGIPTDRPAGATVWSDTRPAGVG